MFSDADKINIFPIIILVFLYQLFPAPFSQCSPQPEPHLSAGSSRWAQKPSLKQGCSVGFHLLRSGRPQHLPVPQQGSQYGQPGIPFHGRWWAAAHLLAPQLGRVHPGCPQARGGVNHELQCRPERPGAEEDGVGQGGGSARGQVQHWPRCQCGTG